MTILSPRALLAERWTHGSVMPTPAPSLPHVLATAMTACASRLSSPLGFALVATQNLRVALAVTHNLRRLRRGCRRQETFSFPPVSHVTRAERTLSTVGLGLAGNKRLLGV